MAARSGEIFTRNPLFLMAWAAPRLTIKVRVIGAVLAIGITGSLLAYSLVIATVRVALDDAGAEHLADSAAAAVGQTLALVGMVTMGTALLVAAYLARTIGRSIGEITDATRYIAHGSFGHRIRSHGRDELAQLSAAVDAMAAQLQQLESARAELLAKVSHELRTPLTIIRGEAFSLSRNEVDGRRLRALSIIEDEVTRVSAMIDDLLQCAHARSGALRPSDRDTPIGVVATGVAERMATTAAHRNCSIRLIMDRHAARMLVDGALVDRAICNLIINAMRHADSGTEIELTLELRGKNSIAVSVANIGEPIGSDKRALIFEPFVQGGASAQRNGAVGLGLAIVRDVARAHGGDAWLRCAKRRVCVGFTVSDELSGVPARASRQRAAGRSAKRRLRTGASPAAVEGLV